MELPVNHYNRALQAGRQQIGLWCNFPTHHTVELLARSGFGWLLLDMEHCPNDMQSLHAQLMAMTGGSLLNAGTNAQDDNGMFVWSQRFEFGIQEIDSQHRRLFALANTLDQGLKRGESAQILAGTLMELLRQTEIHFRDEERILQECHYPDLAPHKALHDGFTRKVRQFVADLKQGRGTVSMDLLTFLRDWLYNHILKSDAAFVPKVSMALTHRRRGPFSLA